MVRVPAQDAAAQPPALRPQGILTRGRIGAGAVVTAVPNRFKNNPEELCRGQGRTHLGSCLLKDLGKL